ncbi:MAG: STAS domain-containing protein [Clostridia bacterium]|nr:STAS domain-containing protein [Clostridia bacterium]
MEIIKKENGSALTLELRGRLDTITSPTLEAVINTELDGVQELTIDCSYLEYISSAGLRVLLSAQKKMNEKGSMKVTNVNEMVGEIFEITGFCDILSIE